MVELILYKTEITDPSEARGVYFGKDKRRYPHLDLLTVTLDQDSFMVRVNSTYNKQGTYNSRDDLTERVYQIKKTGNCFNIRVNKDLDCFDSRVNRDLATISLEEVTHKVKGHKDEDGEIYFGKLVWNLISYEKNSDLKIEENIVGRLLTPTQPEYPLLEVPAEKPYQGNPYIFI